MHGHDLYVFHSSKFKSRQIRTFSWHSWCPFTARHAIKNRRHWNNLGAFISSTNPSHGLKWTDTNKLDIKLTVQPEIKVHQMLSGLKMDLLMGSVHIHNIGSVDAAIWTRSGNFWHILILKWTITLRLMDVLLFVTTNEILIFFDMSLYFASPFMVRTKMIV